jgi:hypothetical protein
MVIQINNGDMVLKVREVQVALSIPEIISVGAPKPQAPTQSAPKTVISLRCRFTSDSSIRNSSFMIILKVSQTSRYTD